MFSLHRTQLVSQMSGTQLDSALSRTALSQGPIQISVRILTWPRTIELPKRHSSQKMIKVAVLRDFLFHESNPPGPLFNRGVEIF